MFRTTLKPMLASVCVSAIGFVSLLESAASAQKPNLDGKIVLANLDRYDASIRVGETRRDIKPKKASVLTPKQYPAAIEYWSGNTKAGWQKQTIESAGIYGLNFKSGKWELKPLQKGTTATNARPLPRAQLQTRIVRPQVARRTSARSPINVDRRRWSPLARAVWVAGSVYQIVRDERDRDVLRELLIRGREEDLKELDRWIDDSDKIALPHKEELKEAFDELKELSDKDWEEIETADDKAWEQAKADVGDLISDEDWKNVSDDFAEINTNEFWEDDVEVDLDQVDFADNLDVDGDGDLDIGDLDISEDIDVGDIGIEQGSFDLGEFDDFGGFDGDSIPDDFGGGDFGGGDFDGGFMGDDDFGDFGGGDDFDFGGGDDFDF